MKLKIVHESRGRVRFRLGNGRFLKSQECPIEELLSALPYVRDAKASSVNGGILVLYKQGFREELIAYMKGIKLSAVEKRASNENEDAKQFRRELAKLVIRRYAVKHLIPSPIGIALTYYKAIPYIKKAFSSLAALRADVSLLDGTAVGAALLRGMYRRLTPLYSF